MGSKLDMRVHALEGTMVSTQQGVKKLLELYESNKEEVSFFVLSPVKAPELSLQNLIRDAAKREERLWSRLEKSQAGWNELATSVLKRENSEEVTILINKSFSEIEDILKAVWILGSADSLASSYFDYLTSVFLSCLLTARFKEAGIDASYFNVDDILSHRFDLHKGVFFVYGKLKQAPHFEDASGRSRQTEGEAEYTASLIAQEFKCPITFWNNKSLLCTASRKDVPSSKVIRHLTYSEATELSFFGAPIIHPQSFQPASSSGLEISLRYWGDIKNEGTEISAIEYESKNPAKAFSVVKNVSLINVEGSGMSGVPGVSSRLFTALRNEEISVIFISQASSEYSICLAVPQAQANAATRTIRREFAKEIEKGSISSIEAQNELSILAVVGENMNGRVGVAGMFFSSLARAGVNIRAIAQGSSEMNISAVIASNDSTKALRALHATFFMSEQTLSIGLFGPGNIGGTLLNQIGKERERLRKEFDLDIRIRGIATSKKMLLSEDGINLKTWKEDLEKYGVAYNEEVFLNHIMASYYPHWVLVDCTSSLDRAMQYKSLIERGFNIITPNKKASSGPIDYYKELLESSRKTGKKFYYETTVGAGLPIINTLKDLRETGDHIEKIEGMVSGTLAWLFSEYDGTVPFSTLVLKAKELGFTEPDPRDDLSGMDVARKTVILARELGFDAEIGEFKVESLVPENLKALSKEEFIGRLSEMDERMLALYKEAEKKNMRLRYVGKVDNGVCSVALEMYPVDHPFSQAKGTDNVIAFTTSRYHEQPLVIKGPGAGPEVTAAGVFADILRLSAYLGSKI